MASFAATSDLVSAILPTNYCSLAVPYADAALTQWSQGNQFTPPQGLDASTCRQKTWDGIATVSTASALLEQVQDDISLARLLAAMTKVSGAWLQALPMSSLGLRMDDSALRIAVGLSLGTAIYAPHFCHHCGAEVDCLGTHGLSCHHSEGRLHRHASINSIIHRALTLAQLPSHLEPSGLLRSDGRRPDGTAIVP